MNTRDLAPFWMALNCTVIVLGLTISGSVYALDSNGACTGRGIKTLNRALRDSEPEYLRFKYQYVRQAKSGFPTVVYLPGGPGGTSIGDESIYLLIPDSFGLILTDPRGAGCNQNKKFRAGDFSSARSAEDILAIFESQRLQASDLIIFGKSYGTVLATYVSELNFKKGREPFRKIILEGTLGYGSRDQNEYLRGYVLAFKNYFSKRPGLLKNVETAVQKYRVDRKIFAQFLTSYLIEGNIGKPNSHLLDQPLEWLTDGINFKVFEEQILKPFQKEQSFNSVSRMVWQDITCTELSPLRFQFSFQDENLIVEPSTTKGLSCPKKTFTNSFDAKQFQLREDILYAEGSEDPATPPFQAVYHFNNQRGAKNKRFILFDGFGHSIFSWIQLRHPGLVKEIFLQDFDPRFIREKLPELNIEVK